MTLFIGVDGGGTKTEIAFLNPNLKLALTLTGPASNPHTVGIDKACTIVAELIQEGLQKLQMSMNRVAGLSIGMAGVDRPEQIQKVHDLLQNKLSVEDFEVVNDALPALTAGTEGTSGAVLIAGTGSIAVGEDEFGNIARAGGYGYLIGDEGSGFEIGRFGLMAAVQGFEGRGPRTQLMESVMEFYQIRQPEELITKIYDSSHPVGTIASFAGEVLRLWTEDNEADRIMQSAVQNYMKLINSVFNKLGDSSNIGHAQIQPNVILSGGLFVHFDMLVNELAEQQPKRHFRVLKQKAAFGAVLRAMKRAAAEMQRTLSTEDLDIWRRSIKG